VFEYFGYIDWGRDSVIWVDVHVGRQQCFLERDENSQVFEHLRLAFFKNVQQRFVVFEQTVPLHRVIAQYVHTPGRVQVQIAVVGIVIYDGHVPLNLVHGVKRFFELLLLTAHHFVRGQRLSRHQHFRDVSVRGILIGHHFRDQVFEHPVGANRVWLLSRRGRRPPADHYSHRLQTIRPQTHERFSPKCCLETLYNKNNKN